MSSKEEIYWNKLSKFSKPCNSKWKLIYSMCRLDQYSGSMRLQYTTTI